MKLDDQVRLLEKYRLKLYEADEGLAFQEETTPEGVEYDEWVNYKNNLIENTLKAIESTIDDKILELESR